jgi:hypothetical protein
MGNQQSNFNSKLRYVKFGILFNKRMKITYNTLLK